MTRDEITDEIYYTWKDYLKFVGFIIVIICMVIGIAYIVEWMVV